MRHCQGIESLIELQVKKMCVCSQKKRKLVQLSLSPAFMSAYQNIPNGISHPLSVAENQTLTRPKHLRQA